ncbi:hypothetical protein C8A00DRAFT_40977 [Chaetomidium leptoderma]|uniref:Uncharacterized protein n=1 Tax=Chaetomidium leptoderma TaxID=669021 RepID=A0AAN6ZZJ6_9PEZI|nr:hypothetical protein C8A00DRAFT_40977 [Chaetomidium leptoderma]
MPALPPLHLLVGRTAANTNELQVICSFPVSGQYGPGSRILYYVLVAACVLARKTEWLRNACLAAALIFPAIAAIHAIVLAALHVDDAIDMDIYGALQLCSIGILTAPATVRLSKTYFNNPGRNVLFLWTVLVLAGLIALAVEFFRSHSNPCTDDGTGKPLYRDSIFPYGNTTVTCGLKCSTEYDPLSPMRSGSADNVYVVPAPHVLSFGAATLLAAACCIPGILSMVSTWDKIARTNWAKQWGTPDTDEVIEGTNGATFKGMNTVNDMIRRLLSVVEVPVFSAAVLAIIIVGELNFWSYSVNYQTEPIANVGQWSNVCASVFAACGSLYMFSAKYLETAEKGDFTCSCNCGCHEHSNSNSSRPDSLSDNLETSEITRPPHAEVRVRRRDTSPPHMLTATRTDTYPDEDSAYGLGIRTLDTGSSITGHKHGVAQKLIKIAAEFGTASPDRYDNSSFRHGKATGFPEVPGESNRNGRLPRIKKQWGEPSDDIEEGLTPRGRRSRANSFNDGISRSNSIGPRAHSPQPPPSRPQPTGPGPSLLGLPTTHSPESISEPAFPPRPSTELDKTKSQSTVVTLHQGAQGHNSPPAIILSAEDESSDASASGHANPPPAERPALHVTTHNASSRQADIQ